MVQVKLLFGTHRPPEFRITVRKSAEAADDVPVHLRVRNVGLPKAEPDLLAALPRMLVAKYSARLQLTHAAAPTPLQVSRIRAITPKAAMMDAGTAWLFNLIEVIPTPEKKGRKTGSVTAHR